MINPKSVMTILFSILSILVFIIVFYFFVKFNRSDTIVVEGIEKSTQTYDQIIINTDLENNIVLQDENEDSILEFFKIGENTEILQHPVPVILYSGSDEPFEVMTNSITVRDFLIEQGINLRYEDIVIPSLDSNITPDLEIIIKYIDIKQEYEESEIDYELVVKYNDSLYEGDQRLIQDGKKGLRVTRKEVYYENGEKIKSEIIYSNIEIDPINKIIEKGTKKNKIIHVNGKDSLELVRDAYKSGSKIKFLGEEYSISNTMVVEATAFYNSGSNSNHITATGNPTNYNPNGWSTIAVDPKIIPLNTKVYVEGYGFGVAHDTGGAIKGDIIDVFMPNRNATYTWGRKKGVKIYILN